MAKIGRIDKGDRPSGVPGGRFPVSPQDASAPFQMAANVADVGMRVAAQEEYAEAKRRRDAEEALLAITNETTSGRLAGEFEDTLAARVEELKAEHSNSPEKLPAAVRQAAQEISARALEGATNTAIALQLSKDINSKTDSAVREGRSWALGRGVQIAKVNFSGMVNRVVADARTQPSLEALTGYLAGKKAALGPLSGRVLGAEGPSTLGKMESDATEVWVTALIQKDPVRGAIAVKDAKGLIGTALTGDQRKALESVAITAYHNMVDTDQRNLVEDSVRKGDDTYDLLRDDKLTADIILSRKKAIQNQRQAIKAGIVIGPEIPKEFGIDVKAVADAKLAVLDNAEAVLDAVSKTRWKQIDPGDVRDSTVSRRLLLAQEEAIKAKGPKKLDLLAKQQLDLAVARLNKTAKPGELDVMDKDLSREIKASVAAESNVNKLFPDTWQMWGAAARQAGTVALNVQFAGDFSARTDEEKQATYIEYVSRFNAATKDGTVEIDEEAAKALAYAALQFITAEPVKLKKGKKK